MRPSASFNSVECGPDNSVNTLRSVLPAKYGHGEGLVTKKRGNLCGALICLRSDYWVDRTTMPIMDLAEKGIYQQSANNRCLISNSSIQLNPLNLISSGPHAIDQPLKLLGIACFAFNIGDQSLGGQCRENPLMVDFNDIDVMIIE
jgi:hypothetical protein